MLFFVLFVFSVWGTWPCYLQHFGAKMRNVDGICNILEYFGPWILCWQKIRSILEPAFEQYHVHYVYRNLEFIVCMVFVAFWRNNLQFAWYLLHVETWNLFSLLFSCFLLSTIAAAYWQFLGFSWGLLQGLLTWAQPCGMQTVSLEVIIALVWEFGDIFRVWMVWFKGVFRLV